MAGDLSPPRIRRLAGTVDDALDGLGPQRLAEITHLPTGIAGEQFVQLRLEPGGQADLAPAAAPALLHVAAGQVLLAAAGAEALAAGAGDTLLVPAGVPFRASNPSESTPVQLLLVHGA